MSTLAEKFNKAEENNRQLSAYRPLPPETLQSLREYYRVGLTYTSNALEGNSLTESETKVVIEDGLTIEAPSQTSIVVHGIDKEKVGQLTAEIRKVRPPEPYKGKGIKYIGERIIRKEGKVGKK